MIRINRSIDVDWKKNGKDDFFSIPDFRLKKERKGYKKISLGNN